MSGWIKLEKDIRSDPRFLRMCKGLRNSDVTQLRLTPELAATLLVGCLAQLWMYADSHIREDDTLDLGPDEIDELVGVQGFTNLMPVDWLEVIDQHCVKLPSFQEHNGTDAKKRALTAKRVERHRIRNVTQERINGAVGSNACALPDQTRPDQTKPDQKEPRVVPQSGTAESEDVLRVFDHWRTTHEHPKASLDPKRRKKIREALKAYSEADLCMAITGYLNSPHHMGQNDTGTKYTDLELLLRDSAHIDAGIAFYDKPPLPRSKAQISQDANVNASVEWIRRTSHVAG